MPNFRRGASAITAAQESNKNSGGGFAPFAPNLIWKSDREEKYVVFLNTAEDLPTVDLHEWIITGHTKNGKPIYDSFISRKDAAIGDTYDDIEDRLGQKPRSRTIGVAVELEPTFAEVKGRDGKARQRPNGFQVKTGTYERKTEEGTEEVTYPEVGFVIQSPLNFYGWIGSFSESTAPIEDTPLHILRRGKDANTAYDFTPYIDQPIDYTGLIEHIEGLSYLRDEMEELVGDLENLEPNEAALHIGNVMLEKRLDELADGDRYERLVSPIEEIENKWGNNTPAKNTSRPARPERPSPRVTNGRGESVTATAVVEEAAPRSSKFAKLRQQVEGGDE